MNTSWFEHVERLPGLYRAWELPGILKNHQAYQIEDAGAHQDGTPLLAVYTACDGHDLVDLVAGVRSATHAAEEGHARLKDTGTVQFDVGDFTMVADLPKWADWDQDRLGEIVERIRASGDDPAQYVVIFIKVPERKDAAWPDNIRAVFEPARTVRTGALRVEIVPQGGAA